MTTTQGVKLDDDIKQRLKVLGEIRNRSPHWLMRTAIQLYLEREEAYEREKREDMERWQEYQLTGHAISHDVATAWLDNLAEGEGDSCPK